MTKVLASPVITQWLDNLGVPLNGGLLYTYVAGTTTPKTTWTDSTGNVAQPNPITLDAAGREPGGIWATEGDAYKFVLKTGAEVTVDTIDNVIIGGVAAETTPEYELILTYTGTPLVTGWMGGVEFKRAMTFPADFDGSGGSVVTSPGATYEIDVKLNGNTCGTISISTGGAFTFTTSGGGTVSVVDGDTFDFYGPNPAGTAANFKITLVAPL